MLAFAGIVGYTAVSAYQRHSSAKKIVSKLDTNGYNHVLVIYKSHWLCPNLKVTVIGFNDRYINEDEKIALMKHALTQNNTTQMMDQIRTFKSDVLMEAIAMNLAFGGTQEGDRDGKVIHEERAWVFPSIMPGGVSRISYKRNLTTNELEWAGSTRSWADLKTNTSESTSTKTTDEGTTVTESTKTSQTMTIYSLSTPPSPPPL
jgi:hypothetical protein